jgi:hypothetical protein
VPSTVTAAFTGTIAPTATLIVAPLVTPTTVDANRPVPLNANVPAFTVVDPVNVFTPLNSNVPPLTFTNEPGVVPFRITPANVPSPSVNAVPFNVTRPLEAPSNVSNSTPAADNANVPSTVTAAFTGTIAPAATLIVAPLDTPTTVDANRPAPLNANVPTFTVVDPVNVFTPLNSNVPPLTFTNEPAPLPFRITPSNVPSPNVNSVPFNVTRPLEAPPNVSNSTPAADNANVPSTVTTASTGTIASCATVIVAPLDTPTTVDANRPVPLNANVPAFTVVDPVNVFTPLNSNVPPLTFTNDPSVVPF